QESSLRCLDLLADADLAARLHQRFPVILVDDLHLARPDQIALIQRLVGPQTQFTAAAWLTDTSQIPDLKHVRAAVEQWGPWEQLQSPPATCVNPAISALVGRRLETPVPETSISHPVGLSTPFTVEDELQQVAAAIVRL